LREGTIVRWISERGFGFLRTETTGEKIFFHVSGLDPGYWPAFGERVRYELEVDRKSKRMCAVNVRLA
jgi:CspA family cold shock protein